MASLITAHAKRRARNATTHGTRRPWMSDVGLRRRSGGDLIRPVTSDGVVVALVLERGVRVGAAHLGSERAPLDEPALRSRVDRLGDAAFDLDRGALVARVRHRNRRQERPRVRVAGSDRKSTRLNSSHVKISYA